MAHTSGDNARTFEFGKETKFKTRSEAERAVMELYFTMIQTISSVKKSGTVECEIKTVFHNNTDGEEGSICISFMS